MIQEFITETELWKTILQPFIILGIVSFGFVLGILWLTGRFKTRSKKQRNATVTLWVILSIVVTVILYLTIGNLFIQASVIG